MGHQQETIWDALFDSFGFAVTQQLVMLESFTFDLAISCVISFFFITCVLHGPPSKPPRLLNL